MRSGPAGGAPHPDAPLTEPEAVEAAACFHALQQCGDPEALTRTIEHVLRVRAAAPAPHEPSDEAIIAAYHVLWDCDPEYISAGDMEGRVLCARDEERYEELRATLEAAYAVDFPGLPRLEAPQT